MLINAFQKFCVQCKILQVRRTSSFPLQSKLYLQACQLSRSAVSLTLFRLFSQPHDITPNLTVFEENHSKMKCYLV